MKGRPKGRHAPRENTKLCEAFCFIVDGAWGKGIVQPAGFRVPFEEIDLENGMRVILSPDHTVPVVAVYVLYGVGARSEERGRSGFAHLF